MNNFVDFLSSHTQPGDSRKQITWLQTVGNIVCNLSTEWKADNMNVCAASISDTIHKLSAAFTNMLYVVDNCWIA